MLEGAIPSLDRLQTLIAATNATRISDLNNALPGLEQLEHVLSEDRARQNANLRKFHVDERVTRLEASAAKQRSEFDALDFVGHLRLESGRALWGWEEFHSGVLAWLLNPKQSNGLNECFLKRFLRSGGVPAEVFSVNWSEVEVIREWENEVDGQRGYLDILIVNEVERILCAVENKTFSREHGEQLTRYRRALEADYSTFTRYHVFLTPWGSLPSRDEERRYWQPLTYSDVFETVEQIAEIKGDSIQADVRAFLRQYATTLRRNLMPDTSVSLLARQIYLEHREAVELLVANRPDWVVETKRMLKEAVAQRPEFRLDVESAKMVRFRSIDWDQYESTQMGSGWTNSNTLFLFEFQFSADGLPRLHLSLSPESAANSRLRSELFEAIRQHPKLFRPRSTALSENWTMLHVDEEHVLDEDDHGVGWDDGTARAKIDAWLADFAATTLPAMNQVIISCLREYEAEGLS